MATAAGSTQTSAAVTAATIETENNALTVDTLSQAIRALANCGSTPACEAVKKALLRGQQQGGYQQDIARIVENCRAGQTNCVSQVRDLFEAAALLQSPEMIALLGADLAAKLYAKQMSELTQAMQAVEHAANTAEDRRQIAMLGAGLLGTAAGGWAVAAVGRTIAAACGISPLAPACLQLFTDIGVIAAEAISGATLVGVTPAGMTAAAIAQRVRSAALLGEQALLAELRVLQIETRVLGAANQPFNSSGLTQGVREWEKHMIDRAGGTGTFPMLIGNNEEKVAIVNAWLRDLANSPNVVIRTLSGGATQYRLPNGQGVRIESNGRFLLID
jgi:hypothetical protein